LFVNANGNSFSVADTIEGNSSSVTATITNVTDTPIVPYTGEIIYRENRSPVSRAETQTEDIKLVVKF
jgi:hypothetical protein